MSIEDEARKGRPVSSVNDKNTLEESAFIEEDPHMTLVEIADAVGISTGTAQAVVMSMIEKSTKIDGRGLEWKYCMITPDHAR